MNLKVGAKVQFNDAAMSTLVNQKGIYFWREGQPKRYIFLSNNRYLFCERRSDKDLLIEGYPLYPYRLPAVQYKYFYDEINL